jgi:hypothetical protein
MNILSNAIDALEQANQKRTPAETEFWIEIPHTGKR